MRVNWRKHAFTRKAAKYVTVLPRTLLTLKSSNAEYLCNPPVIINSFPKSGTHLLMQIAQVLPGMHDWGGFIASLGSSFFYHKVSLDKLCKKIRGLAPGELCGGHIFCTEEVKIVIKNINAVNFFIYRDLRDVAVSEAYYLTYMNKWHRLSKYFRKLPDMEERIMFSITGSTEQDFPYEYPDISQRFACYHGWLNDTNTLSLKYEDLISKNRQQVIREIINHYFDRTRSEFDQNTYVNKALNNINPAKSHTYRQGKAGGWREVFTEQHKSIFKQLAGNLLIELGYEQDNSW